MLRRVFKFGRADTFPSCMKRAKDEGYLCGSREGKLFALAVGAVFTREQALDRLDNVIDEGRSELNDQHATEREVEA
jgi:hypothetical protein